MGNDIQPMKSHGITLSRQCLALGGLPRENGNRYRCTDCTVLTIRSAHRRRTDDIACEVFFDTINTRGVKITRRQSATMLAQRAAQQAMRRRKYRGSSQSQSKAADERRRQDVGDSVGGGNRRHDTERGLIRRRDSRNETCHGFADAIQQVGCAHGCGFEDPNKVGIALLSSSPFDTEVIHSRGEEPADVNAAFGCCCL